MQLRVLIFYHSASGNTSWIAMKFADMLKVYGSEVDVHNIIRQPAAIDFSHYDLIGFGCPVMGFRPSFALTNFIDSLPPQNAIPAFIFTTYSGILANVPWMLTHRLRRQGFVVVGHKHFRSEVSWPIIRAVGLISNHGKPNEQDLPNIGLFVQHLSLAMKELQADRTPQAVHIPYARFNPFSYLALVNSPSKLRSIMGKKSIEEGKCTQCGCCAANCGVRAITLNPYPTFDEKCTGCWGCFNLCPEGAIKTTIVGFKGRYRKKVDALMNQQVIDSLS